MFKVIHVKSREKYNVYHVITERDGSVYFLIYHYHKGGWLIVNSNDYAPYFE